MALWDPIKQLFHLGKKRIVLVEDDLDVASFLTKFLKSHGCRIYHAKDGVIALKLIQDVLPDLVLLDIMLPKMDGIEVLTHLKDTPETKQIPVLMCTALDQMTDVETCIKLGAEGYLVKPFDLDRVWEKINAVLKV